MALQSCGDSSFTAMATSDIVWIKCGRIWWPGQVTENFPPDLTATFKKSPLAVVKYFNEDSYEVVTKTNNMFDYRDQRRLEFIKKGLIHLKSNTEDRENFITDVKEAERRTGGIPSDVDEVKKELDSPQTPKRPSYTHIFKPSPKEPSISAPSASIKFNFRKTPKSHSTQKKEPHLTLTSQMSGPPKKYACDVCGFSSDRVGVVTFHRKTHSSADYNSASSSHAKTTVISVEMSMPGSADASTSPSKVEKPPSPEKTTPVKRRGRKKKEQAKEDILNDWSDDEFPSNAVKRKVEMDESNAPILKKPRTDKELSDAFEALLQSTQPPTLTTESKCITKQELTNAPPLHVSAEDADAPKSPLVRSNDDCEDTEPTNQETDIANNPPIVESDKALRVVTDVSQPINKQSFQKDKLRTIERPTPKKAKISLAVDKVSSQTKVLNVAENSSQNDTAPSIEKPSQKNRLPQENPLPQKNEIRPVEKSASRKNKGSLLDKPLTQKQLGTTMDENSSSKDTPISPFLKSNDDCELDTERTNQEAYITNSPTVVESDRVLQTEADVALLIEKPSFRKNKRHRAEKSLAKNEKISQFVEKASSPTKASYVEEKSTQNNTTPSISIEKPSQKNKPPKENPLLLKNEIRPMEKSTSRRHKVSLQEKSLTKKNLGSSNDKNSSSKKEAPIKEKEISDDVETSILEEASPQKSNEPPKVGMTSQQGTVTILVDKPSPLKNTLSKSLPRSIAQSEVVPQKNTSVLPPEKSLTEEHTFIASDCNDKNVKQAENDDEMACDSSEFKLRISETMPSSSDPLTKIEKEISPSDAPIRIREPVVKPNLDTMNDFVRGPQDSLENDSTEPVVSRESTKPLVKVLETEDQSSFPVNTFSSPVAPTKELPLAVKSKFAPIQQSPVSKPLQGTVNPKSGIASTSPSVNKIAIPSSQMGLPVAIKSAAVLKEKSSSKLPTQLLIAKEYDLPPSCFQVSNNASSTLPKELPIAVKSAPVLIETLPKKTEIMKKILTSKCEIGTTKKEKKPPVSSLVQSGKGKAVEKPLQTYRAKKERSTISPIKPNSAIEKGITQKESIVNSKSSSSEKPTATIRPISSEDDSIIRQALQGTLKSSPEMQSMTNTKPSNSEMDAESQIVTTEPVNKVAEQVVHLVPVENPDGTVTYMLLSLGNQGELCIDATEAAAPTIGDDAIFIDKTTDGDTFFASITQPNPPNVIHQSNVSQKTAGGPIHTSVPVGTPVMLQNQLQGMQILQSSPQSNEVIQISHQTEGTSLLEGTTANTDATQSATPTMIDLSSLGLATASSAGISQIPIGGEQQTHQIVFLAEDGSIINAENVNWADYGAFLN